MLRPTFGSFGGLRAFLGLLGRLIFEALGLLDGEVFFDVLKERFVPATRIKLVDELLKFASAVQCIVVVFGQCLLGFGPVVDVLFAAVHGHLQLLEFELLFEVPVGHFGQGVFLFLQLRNQFVQLDLAVIQLPFGAFDEVVVDAIDVRHLEGK